MRTVGALALVAITASVALAQPSLTPAQPYPPPQQQGYSYLPYDYDQRPMNVQLTVDEQWLLERGFISNGEQVGGGLVAMFFGWGLGQAVQGRWGQDGWQFTLGESASVLAIAYGAARSMDCENSYGGVDSRCEDRGLAIMAAGIIGYCVLRVWETVDAFATPASHNRKLSALRIRLGMPVPMYSRLSPYMVPSRDRDGGVAGVSLRF